MISHEEKIARAQKKKKIFIAAVLIAVGVFIVVLAVMLVLSAVLNMIQDRRQAELEQAAQAAQGTLIFPDPDWYANIFEDEYYMSLDRGVWYDDGAVRTVITEQNRELYPVEVQFMFDVVQMIINGEYDDYNDIFSDEYWEGIQARDRYWDLRLDFPMQRLHNIEIAIIGRTETSVDMRLTYMILRNDGTFRNDLPFSHETITPMRPMVYRLIMDADGEIRVSHKFVYRFAAWDN